MTTMMRDKVLKVTSRNLQDVFKLVRSNGNWEAVNWQKYPPIPGRNPDGDVIIQLQNRSSVSKYVFDAQRSGNSSMCDTHLYGENGFIPCHSFILMQFSPLLHDLILDNIKEFGAPTPMNPICITIKEYRLETMIEALMLFYSGTSYIANSSNLESVTSLLDFLQVDNDEDDKYTTDKGVPPAKNKTLRRYVSLSDSEDDGSPVRDKKKVTASTSTQDKNGTGSTKENKGTGSTQDKNGTGSTQEKTVTGSTQEKTVTGSTQEKKETGSTKENKGTGSTQDKNGTGSTQEKTVTGPTQEKNGTGSTQEKTVTGSTQEKKETGSSPEKNVTVPQSPPKGDKNKQQHATPEENHESIEMEDQEVIILDQTEDTEGLQNTAVPKRKRGRSKSFTAVGLTDQLSPKPSTSKDAKASELRLSTNSESQEPDDRDSDAISEYQPEPAFVSEIESDDEEDYDALIGRRKSRRIFQESDDSEDDVAHTTLGERVKLNCRSRYPKRKRKVIPDYRETESQSSNAVLTKPTSPEPTSVQPVRNRKLLKSELQCRFCRKIFVSSLAMMTHVLSVCATHLKGNIDYDKIQCLLCEDSFDKYYKLVKHAALCYKAHALEDDADSDSSVSDAECLAMSFPSVILKKLSDAEIASIMSSIGDGFMIEPHQPIKKYNLNLKVKKEVPDLFPNLSPRETLAQVKILEREQKESQMQHELRNRSRNIVPPLILNKSRILESEEELQELAKSMFKKLTICTCLKQFRTLEASFQCMSNHKLKRCWICCEDYPADEAAEQHYRLKHYDPTTPETVGCPICKVPMKYLGVARHMKMQHLICLQKAPAEKRMDPDGVFAVPDVPRRIGRKRNHKTLQNNLSSKLISPNKSLVAKKTVRKIKAIEKKIEKIRSQSSSRNNMRSGENVTKDQESATLVTSVPPVSTIEKPLHSISDSVLSQRKRSTRKSKQQNPDIRKTQLEDLQQVALLTPSASTAEDVTSVRPMLTGNLITNCDSGSALTPDSMACDDSFAVETGSNRSRSIAKNINAMLKGTRTRGKGKVGIIDTKKGSNKTSKCLIVPVKSDIGENTTVGSMQSNTELLNQTTDRATTLTSVVSQVNRVSSSPNEVEVTAAQANVSSSVLLVDRVMLESNSSVIAPQPDTNLSNRPPCGESQLVAVAAITVAHAVTTAAVGDAVPPTTVTDAVPTTTVTDAVPTTTGTDAVPTTTVTDAVPTTTVTDPVPSTTVPDVVRTTTAAETATTTTVGYTVNPARNFTAPVYNASPFGRLFQPINTRVSTPAPVYRNQQTPLPPISTFNRHTGNQNNQLVPVPQEVLNNQPLNYPSSAQMGQMPALHSLQRQFGPIPQFGNSNFRLTNASQLHSDSMYCGTTNINGGLFGVYRHRRQNLDVRHPNALLTVPGSPNLSGMVSANINRGSQTFYNGAQRAILPPPPSIQQSFFHQQQQAQLSITSPGMNQTQNPSSTLCQNVPQYPSSVQSINQPRLPPPLHISLPRIFTPVQNINQPRISTPAQNINQPRIPSPLASPLSGWRTQCHELQSSEEVKPTLQFLPDDQSLAIPPTGTANPSSTLPLIVCGKCKMQFKGVNLFDGHFCC